MTDERMLQKAFICAAAEKMSIGNNFLHSNVDNDLNAHIITDTVGEGLAPPV